MIRRLIEIALRVFQRLPDDRVFIDQDAARREAYRRMEAAEAFSRNVALERSRISLQVMGWATETMGRRSRAPMPAKMKNPIKEWLPGLTVQEIAILSKSNRAAVADHIYDGPLIEGVRMVCPLAPTALIFPAPVAPPNDMRERASSRGPGGLR